MFKKAFVSNLKLLFRHLPGRTEKYNEIPQSKQPISGPRFYPRQKRQSTNHLAMMIDGLFIAGIKGK
jgi:hypothetical protein